MEELFEGAAESVAVDEEPKRKPGTFVKGDPRLHVPGSMKGYIEPEDDGAPEELKAVRHVFLNAKKHDRTEPQKRAREMQMKDPKGFWALKAQMEAAHKEAKKAALVGDAEDFGTDRVEKLIDKLLEPGGK